MDTSHQVKRDVIDGFGYMSSSWMLLGMDSFLRLEDRGTLRVVINEHTLKCV